ncbi:MAG: hypothetical protein IMY85_03175 [Chloroflexi bacterium]|nr:hypothetical protein [Chloroflexota bacterium]
MVGREGQGIQNPESHKKKVVGEPYEGKPHVRFEVAGDGNQDMVWVIEALSKETESKQAAQPKSQAPSLDPTTRPRYTHANRRPNKRMELPSLQHASGSRLAVHPPPVRQEGYYAR